MRPQSIIMQAVDPLVLRAKYQEALAELQRAKDEEAMLSKEMAELVLDPKGNRLDIIACDRAITANRKRLETAHKDVKCLEQN